MSTDVLGRLVEVISGQPLDEFFAQRIFAPLGMRDTSFGLRDGGRLESWPASTWRRPRAPGGPSSGIDVPRGVRRRRARKPAFLSGGGGLVSTAGDYLRFVELLRRGGAYDGGRLLGSRTVAHMVRNHLPGNQDLETFGRPLFAETRCAGSASASGSR